MKNEWDWAHALLLLGPPYAVGVGAALDEEAMLLDEPVTASTDTVLLRLTVADPEPYDGGDAGPKVTAEVLLVETLEECVDE